MSNDADKLSPHIQDSFVYLAITDTAFLRIIYSSVPLRYFSGSVRSHVLDVCYRYFEEFKRCPDDHMQSELYNYFARSKVDPKDKELLINYLRRLAEIAEPNKEYVLQRFNSWLREQALKEATIEAAELVSQGKVTEAENSLYKALKTTIANDQDIGVDYFTSPTNKEVVHDLVTTGIPMLDTLVGGYRRGQLITFLGTQKGKKSWRCVHLAKAALMRGLRVLHISHENSQQEIITRYDRTFGSLAESPNIQTVRVPRYNEEQHVVVYEEFAPRNITDKQAILEAREAALGFGGRLIIKKYPMGTATIGDIERLLHSLEVFHDFIPDVLINDYPDIMAQSPRKELRHHLSELYIWHKGLADDRKIVVVVPSQARRSAIEAKVITKADFAEDIRKVAHCDRAEALCQSKDDDAIGVAKIYVVANREGKEGVSCGITMCLDIGQFCISSFLDGRQSVVRM